jgi:hypothetical protein
MRSSRSAQVSRLRLSTDPQQAQCGVQTGEPHAARCVRAPLALTRAHDAQRRMAAAISSMFDPPEGQAPYDYVFDMTGETRHDRPDEVPSLAPPHILSALTPALPTRHTVPDQAHVQPVPADRPRGRAPQGQGVRPAHPAVLRRLRLQGRARRGRGPQARGHDGALVARDPPGARRDRRVRGLFLGAEGAVLLIGRVSLNLVILRIGLVYGPYVNYGQSGSFSRVYSQSWLC